MKTLLILPVILWVSLSWAQTSDFTKKTKDIIKAVDIGSFETEKAYMDMLKTACDRSSCNTLETIKIQEAGKHIVLCNMPYLKSNGLKNEHAQSICDHKQPVFGCDSHSTPLLRKMCYSANNYSLSLWEQKEKKLHNRIPASQ